MTLPRSCTVWKIDEDIDTLEEAVVFFMLSANFRYSNVGFKIADGDKTASRFNHELYALVPMLSGTKNEAADFSSQPA